MLVGVEFDSPCFFIFYLYDKNLAVGVENWAFENYNL